MYKLTTSFCFTFKCLRLSFLQSQSNSQSTCVVHVGDGDDESTAAATEAAAAAAASGICIYLWLATVISRFFSLSLSFKIYLCVHTYICSGVGHLNQFQTNMHITYILYVNIFVNERIQYNCLLQFKYVCMCLFHLIFRLGKQSIKNNLLQRYLYNRFCLLLIKYMYSFFLLIR